MAITNAEMAAAWGDLLGLTPEKITELAALLDQWALGGARLATLARLTTDVSTFNDAAIRMVHDWYGGAADGGPNGDGLYPLMNSDAEVFLLPSPAKIMAGVSGLDPKGTLATTADLPAAGLQGDLWIIGGDAWVWSVSAGVWVNMGPFRGPQGLGGTITDVTLTVGAPGSEPAVVLAGTPEAREIGLTVPAAADGVTPNVSAEVTMIAPGETALVTRSGPDSAPVFTFQLPRAADGSPGREVEMQAGATHMQWRYVGDAGWINLYAKADLQGAKGDKGDAFAFDAKPADLTARAAYDAQPEGFTVLVMDTGMVFARVGATPGVWSDGFPFGQTQNAILEALSELNATPGLLYQSGAAAFEKRAIGVDSDASVPDRLSGDGRWRRQGVAVPLTEVDGLSDALDDKADAAATLVLLGGKEDKTAKGAANGYAGLGADSKVPAAQLTFATKEEVWAGTVADKIVPPSVLAAALEPQPLAVSGGNVSIDGNAGINRGIVAISANYTIPNMTNRKQLRTSVVSFAFTGGPWTTSLGSEFKKYASSPAIPTAAGSKFDLILTPNGADTFYSVLVKP